MPRKKHTPLPRRSPRAADAKRDPLGILAIGIAFLTLCVWFTATFMEAGADEAAIRWESDAQLDFASNQLAKTAEQIVFRTSAESVISGSRLTVSPELRRISGPWIAWDDIGVREIALSLVRRTLEGDFAYVLESAKFNDEFGLGFHGSITRAAKPLDEMMSRTTQLLDSGVDSSVHSAQLVKNMLDSSVVPIGADAATLARMVHDAILRKKHFAAALRASCEGIVALLVVISATVRWWRGGSRLLGEVT